MADGYWDYKMSTEDPSPAGGGDSGKFLLAVVLIILFCVGFSQCGKRLAVYAPPTPQPSTTVSTTSTTATTEDWTQTTSYRYTTRYTMRYRNATQYDAYGVHDYVDAADFADENAYEEFDGDWEEAYDYYEEYAGE